MTEIAFHLIEFLGRILEALLLPLMARFVAEGSHFASGLAVTLIVIAVVVLGLVFFFQWLPAWLALNFRHKQLKSSLKSAKNYPERRHLFASHFQDQVDSVLSYGRNHHLSRKVSFLSNNEEALRLAWSEFKETFIDESEQDEIRNTARPHGYFMRAVKNPNRYNPWSGLFVSIGLLLTFIGIIAVLTRAGCEMPSDGGAGGICMAFNTEIAVIEAQIEITSMTDEEVDAVSSERPEVTDDTRVRDAVISIVGGAAAKFYASIGGLFASILVRITTGLSGFWLRRKAELLCDVIESGLAYIPEQRLIIEQLEAAREQSNQLKTFNTDMAVALSDAMKPVTSQLETIQTTLSQQNEATLGAITNGVGQAVNHIAGGEIRELGRVLSDLKGELTGLSGKLSEGGDAAAKQMGEATLALEAMSRNMETEFETLAGRARKASQTTNEEMQQAAKQINETLASSLAQINQASKANGDRLEKIGARLETLAGDLSVTAQHRFDEALGEAARRTSNAAVEAGQQIKTAFDEAAQDWLNSVDDAVGKLLELGLKMEQNAQAAGRHAESMTSAASATEKAGSALSQSSSALRDSTTPITHAIQRLQEASQGVQSSVGKLGEVTGTALERAEALAQTMHGTACAAQDAWNDYKGRFEQVDENLENIFSEIVKQIESNQTGMKDFATKLDGELAKAVSQFANAVQPVSELADTLEAFTEHISQQSSSGSQQ